jgi:hypothetical protein
MLSLYFKGSTIYSYFGISCAGCVQFVVKKFNQYILATGRTDRRVWGRGEAYTGFWRGNLRERDHSGDPGVDGRIILRWILRKSDVGGMDWMELARDRDMWRALVNAIMNIRVP